MASVFYFPLGEDDPNGVAEIPIEGISKRQTELVRHLNEIKAPASHWLQLACACLRDGSLTDAVSVLDAFKEAQTIREGDASPDEDASLALALLSDLQLHTLFQRDTVERKTELDALQKTVNMNLSTSKTAMLASLHEGLLHLMKGEMEEAETHTSFSATKTYRGRRSLLPFVGQGVVSFKNREYTKALAYLTHVMKRMGSRKCPTDMGRLELAIKIFKKCCPHLGAVHGLISAYLKIYASQTHHRRENFMRMTQVVAEAIVGSEVRSESPFRPPLLVLLARITLICGEYESAAKLSELAMRQARTDSTLAQASLMHARSKHALGQYTDAMTHYSRALVLKPDLALARFGLSQMNIASGNLRNAATSLEQIISLSDDMRGSTQEVIPGGSKPHVTLDGGSRSPVTHEHVGEAVRALQALSSELPSPAKEINWLQTFQKHPSEGGHVHAVPETFVAIGEMLNGRNRMEAFKTALELYRKRIEETTRHNAAAERHNALQQTSKNSRIPLLAVPKIPLRVHNNAAVAFYEAYKERDADWQWNLQLASEHSKKALTVYNEEKPNLSKVTLLFNRARTLEENRQFTQAAVIYKDIIKSTPQYLEAHVQWIAICRRMGMLELAIAQGVESTKSFPHSPLIQTLLGALYMEMGKYQRSKEYLYSVLKGGHSNDVLALVLLGMLNFRTAPQDLQHPSSRQRAREHLLKALDNFRSALEIDKQCLHAAHGASAVIGEFGRCSEIPKLYETVVDVCSRQHWASSPWSFSNPVYLPAAEVNLGHLWFVKRQFTHSIQLYQYAKQLYKIRGNPDPAVQTFIARTQYESRIRFQESAMTLRRLAHLHPWDKSIKFNLALVLQGSGVHFLLRFKVPAALRDDGPLKEIRAALENIDQALSLYDSLKLVPEELLCLKHSTIEDQIQICHEYKQKGEDAFQSVSATLKEQEIQDQIDKEEWEDRKKQEEEAERQRQERRFRLVAEQDARDKIIHQERQQRMRIALAAKETAKPKKRDRKEQQSMIQGSAFIKALQPYRFGPEEDDESAAFRGEEAMGDTALEDVLPDAAAEEEALKEAKIRRTTLVSDDEDDG